MSFYISTVGGRDPRLDTHRTATPIDHPDGSVTRAKLEYPTVNVSFAHLVVIDKAIPLDGSGNVSPLIQTVDSFADRAVRNNVCGTRWMVHGRVVSANDSYRFLHDQPAMTADHRIEKIVGSTITILATESVDLNMAITYFYLFSISGSTLKSFRNDLTTPKISATDTSLASGAWSPGAGWWDSLSSSSHVGARLLPSSSVAPPAQTIIEVNLEGSGKAEDPFRPLLSRSLTPISRLTGLPNFLYRDAKKYDILKAKGFTDDEIITLFDGRIQTHVDLDAVSMGTFELHPDKSPTVIVTVFGDNPYKSGAIERQKAKAKRVFSLPKDYSGAVTLYNQLAREYPHWLAGKDNFLYQIFGLEIFDLFQNVDFYHGELIEHKTHYQQLKQMPEWEIRDRLDELERKLRSISELTDERNKHLAKIREINRLGW